MRIFYFTDSFKLPGYASPNTIHIEYPLVHYFLLESDANAVNCFSLDSRKLVWSVPSANMSINEGAISAHGEYVSPTLSDTILLINSVGRKRLILLDDRCKINSLVF